MVKCARYIASAGKYASQAGSSSCTDCPRNSYSQAFGSSFCNSCPHETFQPLTGQVACARCPNTSVNSDSRAADRSRANTQQMQSRQRSARSQETSVETSQHDDSYCRQEKGSMVGLPVMRDSAEPTASIAWMGILAGALFGAGVLACGCWCAWTWMHGLENTNGPEKLYLTRFCIWCAIMCPAFVVW